MAYISKVKLPDNQVLDIKDSRLVLDNNNKIVTGLLPDFILGQMLYGGTWNANSKVATLSTNAKTKLDYSANTLTLVTGSTGTGGYEKNEGIYYITSVSGTFATETYEVGDWLVATSAGWKKIDNTDAVASVNGKTGVVNLGVNDLSDATTNSPTSGQVLTYNGSAWVNSTPAAGSDEKLALTEAYVGVGYDNKSYDLLGTEASDATITSAKTRQYIPDITVNLSSDDMNYYTHLQIGGHNIAEDGSLSVESYGEENSALLTPYGFSFHKQTEGENNVISSDVLLVPNYVSGEYLNIQLPSSSGTLALTDEIIPQVNADWNATSGVSQILNKPAIPSSLNDLSDVHTTGVSTFKNILKYNVIDNAYEPAFDYDHKHGNITASGAITTNTAIQNGDRLVFSDSNQSNKLNSSSIQFGTATNQYLANNGTWQTIPSTSVGTLTTSATTSQTPVANESLSGNVVLHKVSKTGKFTDLTDVDTTAYGSDGYHYLLAYNNNDNEVETSFVAAYHDNNSGKWSLDIEGDSLVFVTNTSDSYYTEIVASNTQPNGNTLNLPGVDGTLLTDYSTVVSAYGASFSATQEQVKFNTTDQKMYVDKTIFEGTITNNNGTYTCDKTYAQLLEAYQKGQVVRVKYSYQVDDLADMCGLYYLSNVEDINSDPELVFTLSDPTTFRYTPPTEFTVLSNNTWSSSTVMPLTSSNVGSISAGTGYVEVKYNTADGKLYSAASPETAIGSLNTTFSGSQSTSASESFGSTINLHKVSKTGKMSDLVDYYSFEITVNFDNGTVTSASKTPQQVFEVMDEYPFYHIYCDVTYGGYSQYIEVVRSDSGTDYLYIPVTHYAASGGSITGSMTTFIYGTLNGSTWQISSNFPTLSLGTTHTTAAYGDHNHSGVYQPADDDLTAIAGLSGNSGLLKKTAANTWSLDTTTYYPSSNPSGYTSNAGTVTTVGAGTGLNITGTASVNPTVNIASGYKLPTTTEWNNKADSSEIPTVGTLVTTATTVLQTSSGESLSGTVQLHKIAKTGSFYDLEDGNMDTGDALSLDLGKLNVLVDNATIEVDGTHNYLKVKSGAFSKVSGTTSGNNWSTITIDGVTKNIPQGGGGGTDEKLAIESVFEYESTPVVYTPIIAEQNSDTAQIRQYNTDFFIETGYYPNEGGYKTILHVGDYYSGGIKLYGDGVKAISTGLLDFNLPQSAGTFALTSQIQGVGTLTTTGYTSLTPTSSEPLSGSVSLHRVAKTGSYGDLRDKMGYVDYVFDSNTSTYEQPDDGLIALDFMTGNFYESHDQGAWTLTDTPNWFDDPCFIYVRREDCVYLFSENRLRTIGKKVMTSNFSDGLLDILISIGDSYLNLELTDETQTSTTLDIYIGEFINGSTFDYEVGTTHTVSIKNSTSSDITCTLSTITSEWCASGVDSTTGSFDIPSDGIGEINIYFTEYNGEVIPSIVVKTDFEIR